jgi:hypothetical protein
MNFKLWERKPESTLSDMVEYISSKEFKEMFESATPEAKQSIIKKVEILFSCVDQYCEALELSIEKAELEKKKHEWGSP